VKRNGIRYSFAPPYHPSTNGQAERLVQTTKSALRKITSGDWKLRLARFLFSQHMLPSTVTGQSPAELLMGRKLPSHLDLLHPDIRRDMHNKQYEHYVSSTPTGPRHVYSEGAPVYVRNYSRGDKWVPAVVTQVSGPLQYSVADLEGRVLRRHTDQMRRRSSYGVSNQAEPMISSPSVQLTAPPSLDRSLLDSAPQVIQDPSLQTATPQRIVEVTCAPIVSGSPTTPQLPVPTRAERPKRLCGPPLRYRDL